MSVSEFTTAIRRAAAGIWGVPGHLEPLLALRRHRAAGLIAYWKAWKNNKDGSAQHVSQKGISERRSASLTARLLGAAVERVVHQHFTFLGTNNGLRKGTDDGFTLNAHGVFITDTLFAAALPGFTNLFKRWRFRVGAARKHWKCSVIEALPF